jgi:hypothetical protein
MNVKFHETANTDDTTMRTMDTHHTRVCNLLLDADCHRKLPETETQSEDSSWCDFIPEKSQDRIQSILGFVCSLSIRTI